MKIKKYVIVCFALLFGLIACSPEDNLKTESKKEEKKDSSYSIETNHLAVKTLKQLTDAKGVIGIFDVPEMLTLNKIDSAKMAMVATVMAKNFGILQKDFDYLKAEIDGSAGTIYYNNDPNNFIFECVIPIKAMPKLKPKKSQVVVLEATRMLIYNYYGPYQNLFRAYSEIKDYCNKNKIEQTGPLREFYITDPTVVKDSMQWLTRIMLPVK